MALTRKYLKSLGLTDDQIEGIIEEHTATVDGLKNTAAQYKTDAERLPVVEKELNDLKAAGDGGYKEKYEAEKKAHADYKAEVEKKELNGRKTAALDAVLQKAGVSRESFRKQIIKGYDLATLEMDGDGIKDADNFVESIKKEYADFTSIEGVKGVPQVNPPTGGGSGMTKEQIMQIKDGGERRAAMLANKQLFGLE